MQLDSTVKQFTLREDGFKEIRKQALLRLLPAMVLAVATGIIVSIVGSKKGPADYSSLPYTIALLVAAVSFSIFRTLKKQKALLPSYTLTITHTVIGREQLNTPTIVISLKAVRSIEKKKRGGFVVRGAGQHDVIFIPAQIDKYPELEEALNNIKPIATSSTEPAWKKLRFLLPVLMIGLMICVYTVDNKPLVAGSGTLALGLLGWGLYESQKNRNIDRKTKRGMWWVIVAGLSIIAVMITKLKA